jgi:hypothetical protein
MHLGKVVAGGLIGAAMLAIGSAKADTFVGTLPDNDCAGTFGSPFSACAIPDDPATYGAAAGSPIIIKFEFDDGVLEGFEINSTLFPTIDGSEFSFVFGDAEGTTGTWTYTPVAGDPSILAYVAKGGPDGFSVFLNDDAFVNAGAWTTPTGCGPGGALPCGLSHLSFYDSGTTPPPPPPPVPEPASLALLGMGLLGLGYARYRRRA